MTLIHKGDLKILRILNSRTQSRYLTGNTWKIENVNTLNVVNIITGDESWIFLHNFLPRRQFIVLAFPGKECPRTLDKVSNEYAVWLQIATIYFSASGHWQYYTYFFFYNLNFIDFSESPIYANT